MRIKERVGVACLGVLCALAATAATASASPSSASVKRPATTVTGAGPYPDLFSQAGFTQQQINAKIEHGFDQLFFGSPGAGPTRENGQRIYYPLNSTESYVEDIGNQDVRTEGLGYAMMLTVQLNHQGMFNRLWAFAHDQMEVLSGPQTGNFAWHTDTSGNQFPGSNGDAPDGDQWMAAALVFAGDRWGDGSGIDDYSQQAQVILNAMWNASAAGGQDIFNLTSNLPQFGPGVPFTDPSYVLPAFYRVFETADPADAAHWKAAVHAGQFFLHTAYQVTTGLVSDYTSFNGDPLKFGSTIGYNDAFEEDAWRTIANANVDAAWFGVHPWQRAYSNQLEWFFAGRGIATYGPRYTVYGRPLTPAESQNSYEPHHPQGLVAMNSTSAISSKRPDRLDFVRDLWNQPVPSGKPRYYDGMLYLLGLLYDSGQFKDWQAISGS
jgi:oligosaccharide reducing-end xylanase